MGRVTERMDGLNYKLYIGTYTTDLETGAATGSQGIYIYNCEAEKGPELLTVNGEFENPSYLAVNGKRLYAANEGKKEGRVTAYEIVSETGELRFLNSIRIPDASATCQIAVEKQGKYLFTADYGSGSLHGIKLREDGALGEITSAIRHQGKGMIHGRQDEAHVHSVNPCQKCDGLIVADLGTDSLITYRLDMKTGQLRLVTGRKNPQVLQGEGARSFAFGPDGQYGYLTTEIKGNIIVYKIDQEQMELEEIQRISTLPANYKGEVLASHIQVTNDGRYVFAANRIHDSLVVYKVVPDTGKLVFSDRIGSGGRWPRHFDILPDVSGVIVADHLSDKVAMIGFDPEKGSFTKEIWSMKVEAPAFIKIKIKGETSL